MASFLKAVSSAVRQKGLLGALKEANNDGILWALLDGNLFQTKLKKIGATLVGEDQNGNKYWEDMSSQYGRHRWVEYKNFYDYNASTVPPEWHGWLHHISDFKPEDLEALKPTYYQAHKSNLTGKGSEKIYLPKGHPLASHQREWKKFGGWQPSDTSSTS